MGGNAPLRCSLHSSLLAYLLPVIALASFASLARGEGTPSTDDEIAARWKTGGWALVEKYCIECHNADYQEAELDLSPMADHATAIRDAVMWNRVLQMVRFGAMPPEDAPLPTEVERREMGDTIDRALYAVTCDLRPKAGRVTARRLNRAEYQNTIRDLFGITVDVSQNFPQDEVGGGFDNNADVLSMPPMLLEKYIESAEKIADSAILDPKSLQSTEVERSGDGIGVVGDSVTESFYGRILRPGSFAWAEFDIATTGRYRIQINGAAWSKEHERRAIVVYDISGQPIFADRWKQTRGGDNDHSSFDRDLTEGKHFFLIAPVESISDEADNSTDPANLAEIPQFADASRLDEAEIKKGRDQVGTPLEINYDGEAHTDTTIMVRSLQVEGPVEFAASAYPASHWQILRDHPESKDGRLRKVRETAAKCIKPLAERMFRGPVDDETVDRYAGLVKASVARDESYQAGMKIALTALMVSPRFLFRVEVPGEGAIIDETGDVALSGVQLASRLSYFLWSSTPDEQLMRLASEGKLTDENVLRGEVDRMLADPRSGSLAIEFASQWLGLRNLAGLPRDSAKFGDVDADLIASMAGETRELFTHAVRENRPTGELLNADYTFLDRRLADFYGIPWDGSDDASTFRRFSLADSPRRGVLTHASVLTLTSYPTRTSPVQRGKWILENVIGTPPPEPPPNVPELDAVQIDPNASVRERLALHRADPSCASCHKVMDQLGFGFEQFDAIGRFQDDTSIDASGELPGGRTFAGGVQLAEILRSTESKRFAATVSQRLLGFALGRELSPDDRCVIDQMVADNEAKDFPIADIIKSVVLSRPFLYFRPE